LQTMSKRQGGELNHLNWNQDAEPEDAGQFRQASVPALQGRVIKTARRRRPVGGEEADQPAKSAFAGFGGFAKPAASDGTDAASAAFSFLSKQPEGGDAPAVAPAGGGFAFGSSAGKPAEASGFSFGGGGFGGAGKASFGESAEQPAAKKPATAAVFGSFGASEKEEPKASFGSPAFSSPSFSFGAKAEEKPPPEAKPAEPPKSDLLAMFKPTGWSCSVCMVSNPAEKTACLACETPKPGSKPAEKPAPAFGAGGGFSFGAATSSPAGGGFSFGAPASKAEENKENGGSSGFSFGAKSQASEKPVPGAFAFGAKPADEPANGGGSFSFGAKSSTEDTNNKTDVGGFSFGAKTSSEDSNNKAASGGFSFGAKLAEDSGSSSGAFSFGAKPTEAKPVEETNKKTDFSFGSKAEDTAVKPSTGSFGAFGAKAPEANPSGDTGGFSFGSKPVAETSSMGGFGFGSSEKLPAAPEGGKKPDAGGFSFGGKASGSPAPILGNSSSNSASEELSGSGSSGAASPVRPAPGREYLAHLKALNLQVASWINQHLEQNPLVLLTPVFKDYHRHLADITAKYKAEEAPGNKTVESKPLSTPITSSAPSFPVSSATSTPTPAFAFASKSSPSPAPPAAASPKPLASFGAFSAPPADKPTTAAAPFSFGLASSTPASLPAFGAFGSGPAAPGGFSFGAGGLGAPAPAPTAEAEEDEDKPPVVEIKQVTEEDAKYSKKCKLFFKKDGSYVEKGVGMLYIKAVEGEKHQLLVRADTNLGNVLLNILLSAQIPTTRVGKNNVMLVCVPNPPVDPKADTSAPCPMLIRVKDAVAADELKAKIEECSGK